MSARLICILLLCTFCVHSDGRKVKLSLQQVSRNNEVSAAICGTWQSAYTKAHRQAGAHGGFVKSIVAVPHNSGIADRITGLVSVFLWGLAAGRKFQIGSLPGLHPLQSAFNSPHINWERPQDPDWMIEPLYESAINKDYNQTVSWKSLAAFNMIGGRLADLWDGDLTSQSTDTATLMVTTNRGHSVALFDNPFIKPVLEGVGLSPATAFGCIVNYLLVPRPEIFEDLSPQLRAINDHQGLKIGIQIRVGDAMMNANVTLDDFDAFFACAGSIERFAAHQNQRVMWVLASDSQQLRQQAVTKFGTKVVTANIRPEHSAKEASVCSVNCEVGTKGFLTAAGEWWLLGMSDFFVISANSGFGRTAAFRSLRPEATFTIRPGVSPHCEADSFDGIAKLAADWAGI